MISGNPTPAIVAWKRRKSSMPTVPGGMEAQIDVLRSTLLFFAEHEPDRDTLVPWPTDDRLCSAAEIASRISLAGLLQRLPDRRITVTEAARRWLDGAGDVYLVTVMHRHIRF